MAEKHKAHLASFLGKAKAGRTSGSPTTSPYVARKRAAAGHQQPARSAEEAELAGCDAADEAAALKKRKAKYIRLAKKKVDKYTGLNDGAGQLRRLEPR